MNSFRSLATWTSVVALTLLSACGGDNNPSQSPTPQPTGTNSPPTANAGPDRIVAPGAAVSLDGSGSSDANGTIATYAWTQSSGATVTLSAANTATPGFTAPSASGALVFQLTVTDNGGASRSDTVTVTVNASPTSQAGADRTVQAGAAVSLSGSGTDADGTIASFSWKQTAGQSVTLSAPNTGTTTFTAPAVAASLVFELTVTDDLGATHTDTVTVVVTVNAASAPKIVRQPIGPSTIHHGSALFFVVASGEDLTYEWRGPFGFVKSSPEPFLLRTGVDPADDGRCYYVVISNAAGSVTSDEACVTVGDIGDAVLDPFDENLGDDEAVANSYANTLLWLAEQVSGGFTVPSFAALTGTSGIHSGVPRAVEAGESCLHSGSFDGSTFDDAIVTTGALLPIGRHTVTLAWSDCRTTSDDFYAEDGGLRIDYDFPVRFGEGSVTYYFSGYRDAQGRGPLNGIVQVTSTVQGSPGNGLQDNFEIELGDDLSHGAEVVRLDPHISVERRYNDTGSFADHASVAFNVAMQTYDGGGSAGMIYERSESAASFILRFDENGGGGDGESSPFTSLGIMSVGLDIGQTFHLADLELTHDSTWRFTVIPQEECPADVCAEPP